MFCRLLQKNIKYTTTKLGKIARKILNDCGFSSESVLNKKEVSQREINPCIYGFHSFRYFFVSIYAESGVPMALVQDIVGHSNFAMTKHYTRFSNEYRQSEIKKLNLFDYSDIKTIFRIRTRKNSFNRTCTVG